MSPRSKTVVKATLAVIGTIIGAGVFGLPDMFARVGFWPGTVLFWLIALAVLGTHLLYTHVALVTKERLRLSGYARSALGPIGFVIAGIVYPFALMGGLFAYVLLGGQFISTLIGNDPSNTLRLFAWQLFFWFCGSFVVWFGLKFVAKIEAAATRLLIATMMLVSAVALSSSPHGQMFSASWPHVLLPFGVFLFSMMGLMVIGEVVDLTKPKKKDALVAVTVGTLVSALLMWIFGVSFFKTPWMQLPSPWNVVLMLFGFLAVATSFMTVAQDLKATIHLDFHIPKTAARLLALLPPLLFLFIFPRSFLSALDFIGALFWSVSGILVALIAMRLLPRYKFSWVWCYAIPCLTLIVFAIGFVQKILSYLNV